MAYHTRTPGKMRLMAWIPLPYGDADPVVAGDGSSVGVSSRWTQASDQRVRSRLPGIVSRWMALRERGGGI